MSLHWRLIATMVFFFAQSTFSQDVLDVFFSGDTRYRMVGEYPFALTSEGKNIRSNFITSPSLQFNYRFNNVYHETHSDGTETIIQNYSRSAEALIPLSKSSYNPVIGVQITSARFLAGINQSPTEKGTYDGDNNRISLSYAMRLSSTLQFSASIGQSYANPQLLRNYESTIAVQLTPQVLLSLNAGNITKSQMLWLHVNDVNGVLPLDYQMQKTEVSIHLDYPFGTFLLSAKQANLLSLPEASREWETQFVPLGQSANYSLQVLVPLSEQWMGLASYEQDEIGGDGNFLSRQHRYGTFSRFSYQSQSVRFGTKYDWSEQGMVEADIQWRNLSGVINGNVESWPFVSFFDMPLGQRENIEATGSLKFWKLHFSSFIPIIDNVQAGFGITGLTIFPELKVRSWESRFLSYGVRALQEKELAIDVLQASIFSAGLKGTISSIEILYSFNQFIPLRIVRKSEFAGEEISETGSGESSPTSSNSSGGQFHQMVVRYQF